MPNQMNMDVIDKKYVLDDVATDVSPPPGPARLSWDSLSAFMGDNLHLNLTRLAGKYGNVFRLRIANRDLVVLSGLDAIREALVNQSDRFTDRADFDFFQQEPQSHFVELKSGSSWERHHEILTGVMRDVLGGRWHEIEGWLKEEVTPLMQALLESGNQPIDPNRCISLANLSFMQRIIFGRGCSVTDRTLFDEQGLNLLPCAFMNATRFDIIPRYLRVPFAVHRWHLFRSFKKTTTSLTAYISAHVDEHRKSFDPNDLRDMADHLLNASLKLTRSDQQSLHITDTDIVNGSLTQFSAAGTGVPSFALRWALLYMITYPEIQTEVQNEIDRVVGREKLPCLSDRSKLPFTQACINEVLRHSSVSPMAPVYYAANADTTLDKFFVPKNTPVLVNYYSLTRDNAVWKEPDSFNPKRFLDVNGNINKDAVSKFYPFGVGARRCIGEHLGRMQIFVLFTNLLHTFRFEKVPGDLACVKPIPGAFLVPKDFRVIAKRRVAD